MLRASAEIVADIDRLEAASAFGTGRGGAGRHPVGVEELGAACAAAVAVLPGTFRQEGLLKSALTGYAGVWCGHNRLLAVVGSGFNLFVGGVPAVVLLMQAALDSRLIHFMAYHCYSASRASHYLFRHAPAGGKQSMQASQE